VQVPAKSVSPWLFSKAIATSADIAVCAVCLPCCFKNWASKNKTLSQQQTRRQQCGLVDVNTGKIGPDGKKAQESYQTVPAENVAEDTFVLNKPKEDKEVKKEKERKKQEGKSNVFGIERYPIPQYRWGFLPIAVERFLHTKNNKFAATGRESRPRLQSSNCLSYARLRQAIRRAFLVGGISCAGLLEGSSVGGSEGDGVGGGGSTRGSNLESSKRDGACQFHVGATGRAASCCGSSTID
jgi:hypothetical protein